MPTTWQPSPQQFFFSETKNNMVNNFGFIESIILCRSWNSKKYILFCYRFWFLILFETKDGGVSNKGYKDLNWKVYQETKEI
jgi:hypothetical protein